MSSSKYLYFYSNTCKHCNEIQLILDSNDNLPITKVCIDHLPKHKIPSFVKYVPTLYCGNKEPLLVGEQILYWLQKRTASKVMASSNIGTCPVSNEPCGYDDCEMSGSYSDSYSYLENNAPPIKHNFVFLDETSSSTLPSKLPVASPEMNMSKQNELSRRLESFKTQRESEIASDQPYIKR